MRNRHHLLLVVVINWLLFAACVWLRFTSPNMGVFVPAEVASESLFTYYRYFGDAFLAMAVLLFFGAVFSTRLLIQNFRQRETSTEKAKHRESDSDVTQWAEPNDADAQQWFDEPRRQMRNR